MKQKNSKSSTAPASSKKQNIGHTQTSKNLPSPTSNSIIPKKEQYIKPIEHLEVKASPETTPPKPKQTLLNVLTDLTKNLPPVEDPVIKIPEDSLLVVPKFEVENNDKKNDIIANHTELTDALEIVGNKVEDIVESKPNIHPDGPILRVGRRNRGYIKKQDFVYL